MSLTIVLKSIILFLCNIQQASFQIAEKKRESVENTDKEVKERNRRQKRKNKKQNKQTKNLRENLQPPIITSI